MSQNKKIIHASCTIRSIKDSSGCLTRDDGRTRRGGSEMKSVKSVLPERSDGETTWFEQEWSPYTLWTV